MINKEVKKIVKKSYIYRDFYFTDKLLFYLNTYKFTLKEIENNKYKVCMYLNFKNPFVWILFVIGLTIKLSISIIFSAKSAYKDIKKEIKITIKRIKKPITIKRIKKPPN